MSTVKGLPTLADFSERTGAIFHANRDGRDFDLRLASTESFVDNARQTNFSVMFIAPGDVPAEQGVYTLANGTLGPMDILLVPVGHDHEGLHFEAVFNYIHEA
jgi:hypothetical protein